MSRSKVPAGSKGKKQRRRAKKKEGPGRDRYRLYLSSVQAPDVDVVFFARVYRQNFRRRAEILREDFCGTAAVCAEWVRGKRERKAYGVDLDPEPLQWGETNILSRLSAEPRSRVSLIEGDVRSARAPKADVIAAQNFSYCIFKTRDLLRAYFRAAYKNLRSDGVLILDLFGGYESIQDDHEDVTEHDGFDYVWEQASFDPVTHFGQYHIHFRFPDGTEMKRAFSYDWRLWTIPEVRELLLEAGFKRADVYWEDTDHDSGEGTGVFRRRDRGESDPAWNTYIVGVKSKSGA